jgi:hypothetical protein
MQVQLTLSYIVTTDHSASSYGQPVLVNLGDEMAYAPSDSVELYSGWGRKPAALHVQRIFDWRQRQLSQGECTLVESFIKGFATV